MQRSRKVTTQQIWNKLLQTQVRLTRAGAIHYFESLPAFQNAHTILEIGSGNGSFLSSLADAFPCKVFRGVELCPGHVRLARQRAAYRTNLHFSVRDLYDGTELPRADFIVARLVVQHLRDLPNFLDLCSRALSPGGHLLIIEVDNDGVALFPPAPDAESVLRSIRKRQKFGGPEGSLRILARNSSRFGFDRVHDRVVVNLQRGQIKELTRNYWTHLAHLAEQVWNVPVPWHMVERDLNSWRANPNSSGQFNCRHVLYKKQGALQGLWARLTLEGRRATRT